MTFLFSVRSYMGDFHPHSGLYLIIYEYNWYYKTPKACFCGKSIVSLSNLVLLRLMLNISVQFCRRKRAIVLTWVPLTINLDRAPFLVCGFDVCIKIVHLVALKRTLVRLALNIRVIVEETGLLCCCFVDLFMCIDPE